MTSPLCSGSAADAGPSVLTASAPTGSPLDSHCGIRTVEIRRAPTDESARTPCTTLIDTDGHAFTAYAAMPGSHVLIRPDGHLAHRW
ncbi:hypothetical protein ACIO14_03040 [Nocardia fluminea]|uniref:hypothetical protein n=1 Tax=Nocardia fluminea TaxID=134984 RepID=UPI003812E2C4